MSIRMDNYEELVAEAEEKIEKEKEYMEMRILNYDDYAAEAEKLGLEKAWSEADFEENVQAGLDEYVKTYRGETCGLVLFVQDNTGDYNIYVGCEWTEDKIFEVEFVRIEKQ